MKKVQIFSFVSGLLLLTATAFGQKGIELTIKYNTGSDRYEVYAKSNFTKKSFLLGPSQITVLVPSNLSNEKLRIYNVDGGTWDDNSTVYAPGAKPGYDFHGIGSMGAKIDLVAGNETLLFYFALPKTVVAAQVSLYQNGKDPNSSASGMKGGDFANVLYDVSAQDVYLKNYQELKKRTTEDLGAVEPLFNANTSSLTLYPNITKDVFQVLLNGINDGEAATLTVSTESGKELMRVVGTKQTLENRTYQVPTELSSQSLIVRVKTSSAVFGKRLLVNKE